MVQFEGDINDLKLQENEVESVKWISLDEFEEDINDPEKLKKYVPRPKYYQQIIDAVRSMQIVCSCYVPP